MLNGQIMFALVVLATLAGSCARRADAPGETSARQPRDAQPPDPSQTGEIVKRIDDAAQPKPSGPHPMLGEWALTVGDVSGGTPGLRLTLVVDSGTSEAFFGRVTHFFSGNVGLDPRIFRPFRGTVSEDGRVEIPIEPATSDAPPLHLGGRLRGDALQLDSFTVGRDTITIEEGSTALLRKP